MDRIRAVMWRMVAAVTQRGPSRHTPWSVAFRRPWPGTRRGFKLWLISVILGIRGIVYILDTSAPSGALTFPFDWITINMFASVVVVVSGGAVFSSYCHLGRDRYGYMAMTGLAGLWAFTYVYGYLFVGATSAALQGMLSFGLIVVLLMHCAGDPEIPRDVRRLLLRQQDDRAASHSADRAVDDTADQAADQEADQGEDA